MSKTSEGFRGHHSPQYPDLPADSSSNPQSASPASSSRRAFLGGAAAIVTASVATPVLGVVKGIAGTTAATPSTSGLRARQQTTPATDIGPLSDHKRAKRSFNTRVAAAQAELNQPLVDHTTNGDEQLYPTKIGNYSKGLPHNNLGEVSLPAYSSLISALTSGNPADFENITMGLGKKLTNPQAGLAFDMMGPDSHILLQVPPPAFASAEEASEMAENYWMALLRDLPFAHYDSSPLAGAAAADLSKFSNFKGPKVGGQVTGASLFRSDFPGCGVGPYLSQFFWPNTPFGSETVNRQMLTAVPGVEYMTSVADWLNIQNGGPNPTIQLDPVRRYLRNGRDIGQWVHMDVLFQAYFDALLVLGAMGEPLDPGNPYVSSRTQTGFGTLGDPYNASVVGAVAKLALKGVWFQKWFVHRRLRPEEFGGRVHNHLTHAATYPIHQDLLNSSVLDAVFGGGGTFLLPMAFPEGCPTHPAYGAGHATVAGACTTVLKALFDESAVLPNPVISSDDGLSLVPFTGADLTVGGELNKLATNVAIGRNIAGVHWRSDATESLKLGEEIGIRFLKEEHECFNEQYAGLSLTKFDGTKVTI